MKKGLLGLVALLLALTAYSQHTLKGRVVSEDTKGVGGASITLKQQTKSISVPSDENGYFQVPDLTNGKYQIRITAIGFLPLAESVTLTDTTHEFNFILKQNTTELQTVEVVGRTTKQYHSEYSFSATKTATLNKDLPQSISAVTKELIADRQAFQLGDAVKTVSGVIPSSYYNQYTIRGISQNEEGQIVNGMRTRQYYFLQPLTTNIERVEVLKGPASVTFSSVDPGGSINLVTKKPLAAARREVSLSVGSFSTLRGILDFTGPLNESKTLLYRLNGAYQEARSFRDLVQNDAFLLSPSITYVPNEKTSINAELILSNQNGTLDRGQPIFGAVEGVTSLKSTPISLNLGSPNDFFSSKEFIVTGTLSHKLTKHIAFNTAYMKQTWQEDLQEHRTTNAFAVDTAGQPITSLVGMQYVQRQQSWNIDNLNSYFNFNLTTGKVSHQFLIGYDLHRWQKLKGSGQNAARGFLLKDGRVASSFVRANLANYQTVTIGGVTMPRPNVAHFDLNNPSYTLKNSHDYNLNVRTALPAALTTSQAVYMQEQLRWNRFILLLSLRHEWFTDITNFKTANELDFTQTAWVPRVGLTYAVTKNVNVYGTYLEGFQPQSNTVTLMPNTGAFFGTARSANQFKPLLSDLKELGGKATLWDGKMQINLAGYEINQKNLLMNANLPEFPDSLTTRGAERSRGVEVEVAGYLLPDWQINASYSYIDAVIKQDNDPSLIGARKQNTPYHSYNFWTRYNFPKGTVLEALGMGLGLQHVGDQIPWFTRGFSVPAYTLLDMAMYYSPGKSHLQIALNVKNVTNQTYWLGAQNYVRLFPGAPRNFMLTATYRF
jgi:iron complex outermembrane receptor protein